MEVFENQYFHLNRKLLASIGLWPYGIRKKSIRLFCMALLIVSSVPHLISAVVNREDIDRLMLNILIFCSIIVMFLKMLGLIVAEGKMEGLYRIVADNWQSIHDEQEQKILYKYSHIGKKLTVFYMLTFLVAGFILAFFPLIPKILDKINPLEKSRKSVKFLDGEYFVDRESHFTEMFAFEVLSFVVGDLVSIAVDTAYIVSIEHCCAMYAIVRYRLSKLSQTVADDLSTTKDRDSYDWLIHAIQLHQKALNFTSTISQAYSMCFFFIFVVNIALIPLLACGIISKLSDPPNLLLYVIFFLALALHLFVPFYGGQRILNHGNTLCSEALYCNEWYTTSLRTKKLLLIFMLRSWRPALLDAGTLLLINYETYSTIMRTALSYITVLSSYR